MSQIWEIVGGADKGGIMVRDGPSPTDPQNAERLSTGALVAEISLKETRLQYKLLEGTGPATGWIATRITAKELAVRTDKKPGPLPPNQSSAPVAPAAPPTDATTNGEVPYKVSIEKHWEQLLKCFETQNTDELYHVPGPPAGVEEKDADFQARRKVAQANREEMAKSVIKPLPPWQRFTKPQLEKLVNQTMNGEMYGLPVPPTLRELEKLGAPWLTDAFHAAGTLPRDNRIIKIVNFKRLPMTGQAAAGGSGPKAFITVEYAKPDQELHTELFCKMPWACDGDTKEMGCDAFYRAKLSGGSDFEAQETTVYRYLGPIFPFKVPKYYFADICRGNTNYILITEKVPFGKKDDQKERKPYEIMPCAEKYFDFQLEPRMRYEMYYCLMRAQARMAAWDKMKFFDHIPPEVRGQFSNDARMTECPFPLKLPEKKRAMLKRSSEAIVKLWTEYLTVYAKNLYGPEYRDQQFLDALYALCRETNPWRDDVSLYCLMFPSMTALQHTNLQSDNAYYWMNSEGKMDAGIIDWGGASPRPFTLIMPGSITSAEGEVLDEHEDGLLQCFIDEYYKECGIKIDFHEFRRQWWLNYCNYVTANGLMIEMEIFRETPREEWADVDSLWHPKVVGRWNVRCYAFMIGTSLKYLHRRWVRNGKKSFHCHDAFSEWKEYWVGKGME